MPASLNNELAKLSSGRTSTTTVRLCTLNDPRNSVESYAGLTRSQRDTLYRAAGYGGKPTDNEVVTRTVKEVFSRPHAGRSDRYSDGFNALYTSQSRSVAEAELRYYAKEHFYQDGFENNFEFDVVSVKFRGTHVDLTASAHFSNGSWVTDKSVCRYIGAYFRPMVNAIIVACVRISGKNQVTFVESAITDGKILGKTIMKVWKTRSGQRRSRATSY